MTNNPFGRRSDWKIKASIANAIKYRRKNIRSLTGTSYELLNEHMVELKEAGIIKENGHGPEVTEKGERFLAAYENLASLIRLT